MHSEFRFIQHIKERFSLDRIGDDCAVLPKDDFSDMLVTADLLFEDIDFRLEWADPHSIGHKTLAVSLSDIAAMGGTPKWATMSLGVPENLWNSPFLDEFYAGWHSIAAIFTVELVGGDISRSPDNLVIDSVVIGEVPKGKAILRSGAKPGDLIYVSGRLGGAAAGLKLLESGKTEVEATANEQKLMVRQLRPTPQLQLAKQLLQLKIVTSMIDISDGLSSDLSHICEASGVGAAIESKSIPKEAGMEAIFHADAEITNAVLNGGEDFELLLTVAEADRDSLDGLPVTLIGTITANAGQIELIHEGTTEPLTPSGFRHF